MSLIKFIIVNFLRLLIKNFYDFLKIFYVEYVYFWKSSFLIPIKLVIIIFVDIKNSIFVEPNFDFFKIFCKKCIHMTSFVILVNVQVAKSHFEHV
jgi:hypothetical protein